MKVTIDLPATLDIAVSGKLTESIDVTWIDSEKARALLEFGLTRKIQNALSSLRDGETITRKNLPAFLPEALKRVKSFAGRGRATGLDSFLKRVLEVEFARANPAHKGAVKNDVLLTIFAGSSESAQAAMLAKAERLAEMEREILGGASIQL